MKLLSVQIAFKSCYGNFSSIKGFNWILAFQVTHKQIPQVFFLFFNFYFFCIFLEIFQSDITDILLYFISLFIFQRLRRNEFVVYKYFPLFQKKKKIVIYFVIFPRCKYFLMPKKFNNWKRIFFFLLIFNSFFSNTPIMDDFPVIKSSEGRKNFHREGKFFLRNNKIILNSFPFFIVQQEKCFTKLNSILDWKLQWLWGKTLSKLRLKVEGVSITFSFFTRFCKAAPRNWTTYKIVCLVGF